MRSRDMNDDDVIREHADLASMNTAPLNRWDQTWSLARTAPELEPLEIHLWYLALDAPADLQQLRDCLSQDEHRRADRFLFERHQRRFTVGRALLRQILGSYLEIDAAQVAFDYSGLGKPRIRGCQPGYGLCFNFSNSHERALLGVARDRRVGCGYRKAATDAELAGTG